MLDFCAVAEYFEEKYDYTVPLALPREKKETEPPTPTPTGEGGGYALHEGGGTTEPTPPQPTRIIPTWEGVDTLISREITVVGPDGEKVDVMTFRGGYERDMKDFIAKTPELQAAIEAEDDDAVETIVNEKFYNRPTMY